MTSTASNTKKGPPIGKATTSAPIRSTTADTAAPPSTAKANDFRSVRLDGAMVSAAASIAFDMFNQRDFSGIKQYVAASNSTDAHIRSCGLSTLYGIGCTLAEGLQAAANRGWLTLKGDKLPTAADLHYSFKTDAAAFSAQLTAIIKAAQQAGTKVKGLTMGARGAGEDKPKSEDQPTKVAIVSMPRRATKVELARDEDGEITSATHIEADIL